MRGADLGPWRGLCALPAVWVGLLYDQAALDGAWDLVKGVDGRLSGRSCAPPCLARPWRPASVAAAFAMWPRDVLKLSRAGLVRRSLKGSRGRDESFFLDVLDDIVARDRTRAEDLVDSVQSRNGAATSIACFATSPTELQPDADCPKIRRHPPTRSRNMSSIVGCRRRRRRE